MRISLKKREVSVAIVLLTLPVLFIVSIELILRLYIHFHYGVPGKSYGIYRADKELGAVHRPNSYNSNSIINNWGFRNTENISQKKPDGITRIYCSGGSTTFCYNLRTEEAWPAILQQKLRKIPGHEHDEVLNAGEICFAVAHEFTLAKRLIPLLKPDIVILYGTGINEVLSSQVLQYKENKDFDLLLREKKWGVFPLKLDQARFLKRNSTLVKFFDYKIKEWLRTYLTKKFRARPEPKNYTYLHQWVIYNFENTLRAYLRFLHSNGCKVIIVRYGDNGGDNWYLAHYVLRFRDRAVAIGREEGATICDLASIVDRHPARKKLYIDSGVHVTLEGAELVADVILSDLKNQLEGVGYAGK